MDAIETMASRRVQRAFAGKAVEPDKLEKIVDAGRHAMSARNLQPWQFVVVRDRARLREIGALCSTGRFVPDPPAAIGSIRPKIRSRTSGQRTPSSCSSIPYRALSDGVAAMSAACTRWWSRG